MVRPHLPHPFQAPSIDLVSSLMSALAIILLPKGRIASPMSFIGLSSAATRLDATFPHLVHLWMTAHSPFFRTHTPIGSMRPWQSDERSPGSLSRWMLYRQFGQ